MTSMTASCHKSYLGRGMFVREWGGQRISEYFEVVPFQMTHISPALPTCLRIPAT